MLDRWSPWAPFTGVVFAVLFVVGGVIAAINNAPAVLNLVFTDIWL